MRIDATLAAPSEDLAAPTRLEADGFHTIWLGETNQDAFLRSLLTLQATTTAGVGTSIAIAFSRTPMTVAQAGYDLARYGQGRFVLGLGSQVKAHVERRFSMPWSHPAARMREFVQAMRAIWSCWQDGTPLDFRGEHYQHTLMTPFFTPVRHEWGPPPVYLAGVGELMTKVVGEVADGYFFHPFTTQSYLREVTLPALAAGREAGGRTDALPLVITGPAFVTTGRDQAEMDVAVAGTKKQIAFYGSTPAYRVVLDHHGWGDLQPELTALSKQGRWDDMTNLIPDDLMHAMSVVGTPGEVGAALKARWGDVATSVTLYKTYASDPAIWPAIIAAAQG